MAEPASDLVGSCTVQANSPPENDTRLSHRCSMALWFIFSAGAWASAGFLLYLLMA